MEQPVTLPDPVIPFTVGDTEFDDLFTKLIAGTSAEYRGVPDILTTMFEQQHRHIIDYDKIKGTHTKKAPAYGLENREVQASIREFASYTVEELYEAINHLKNKPWKQTAREVDREAFVEELADAWHFFIELHIIAGVGPTEVFMAYFAKTIENNRRKASGY